MGRGLLPLLLLVVGLGLPSILAEDNLDWWKNAIIYQIYPRSFSDSNGDGIGDLRGIIHKIDYIKKLGVDAVWLTPIYPTEDKDFGYDITDFKDIYPLLGNMSDFDELVDKLHGKGIKLIMDFVPNHTSDEHVWFKNSAKGGDKYENYYVWREGSNIPKYNQPPNNWIAGIEDGSAWTYHNYKTKYYLHQFLPEQPDLNYENPDVQDEMISVLEFWLKKNVDGFRMDAVYTICEDQQFKDEIIGPAGERHHEYTFDQNKTFDVLRKFREKLDEYTEKDKSTRLMMVENYNSDPNVIKKYYGDQEHPIAHFPFNFYIIMKLTLDSEAKDWAEVINNWYTTMGPDNQPNWVTGNHDQHRVASRFNPEYVDLLNIITLTLKGTAITYFGEELGMPDSLVRQDQAKDPQGLNVPFNEFLWKSRDPERGPFLWNDQTSAGFSTSLSPWIPVSPRYWKLNAELQEKTKRSHLQIYKEMVNLRKTLTLKYGNVEVAYINNTLAIFRDYQDNPSVIAVINFSNVEETVDLTSQRFSLPDQLVLYTASSNINIEKTKDNKKFIKAFNSTEILLPPKAALVLMTPQEIA